METFEKLKSCQLLSAGTIGNAADSTIPFTKVISFSIYKVWVLLTDRGTTEV